LVPADNIDPAGSHIGELPIPTEIDEIPVCPFPNKLPFDSLDK
jgi:hypothetical protein